MFSSKVLLTPQLGKVFYSNYATVVFIVDVNHSGTSTDPFIIKTNGVSGYEDLYYDSTTNSQKTIDILFKTKPTNADNLLSSFYFKLAYLDGTVFDGSAILGSFSASQDSFPINKKISIIFDNTNKAIVQAGEKASIKAIEDDSINELV